MWQWKSISKTNTRQSRQPSELRTSMALNQTDTRWHCRWLIQPGRVRVRDDRMQERCRRWRLELAQRRLEAALREVTSTTESASLGHTRPHHVPRLNNTKCRCTSNVNYAQYYSIFTQYAVNGMKPHEGMWLQVSDNVMHLLYGPGLHSIWIHNIHTRIRTTLSYKKKHRRHKCRWLFLVHQMLLCCNI